MDNASIHKNLTLSCDQHHVRYLPPHSPSLNPIEEAFSCWKASVKNELAHVEVHSRIVYRSATIAMGSNLMDYRRGILHEISQSALPCLTSSKITNWIKTFALILRKVSEP